MTARTTVSNDGKLLELTGEIRAPLAGEYYMHGPSPIRHSGILLGHYPILREVTPPAPFPVEYACAASYRSTLGLRGDGPRGIYIVAEADMVRVGFLLSPENLRDLHERLGRYLEALE